MLVWVIYAQTNVTSCLQVVLSAMSLCTSWHCFWWLHLRDLPKCVCFFPKVVPRVSALGLFTSKCFCDSSMQRESQCFLFPFFFFSFLLQGTQHLFRFFPPLLLSKMAGYAVSKQSLVPINLGFPLRISQTTWVSNDLKQTVHAQTHHKHTLTHGHTCTHVLKSNMEIFVLPPFPCLALVL